MLTFLHRAWVQWKTQPIMTASGRTDLNADHRALSKSKTTLLTDGTVGRTSMIFLRTLIKMKNIQSEFDVLNVVCVYMFATLH